MCCAVQLKADTTGINSSHIIHRMSFGPAFPGQINPLDGAPECLAASQTPGS